VTICPEWKTNAKKFNFTQFRDKRRRKQNLSSNESAVYEVLSQICNVEDADGNNSKAKGYFINNFHDVKIELLGSKSNFSMGKTQYFFKDYFNEIFTEDGFCYTFNMLHEKDLYTEIMSKHLRYPKAPKRSNWDIFGYKTSDMVTYPLRVSGSGVSGGLNLNIALLRADEDHVCSESDGFRVSLHTPDEMPTPRHHFFKIPFETETMIKVVAKKQSTTERLRSYKPKQRQCYFPGEKLLRFFKHYNLENCKLECASSE
jgi:acid-sensing ion channel, other